ncbi:Catenin alpha-2, partial [Trichinella sp. T6]
LNSLGGRCCSPFIADRLKRLSFESITHLVEMPSSVLQNNIKGNVSLKWNLENHEIRTKSIERTLQPLVAQVTTLCARNDASNRVPTGRRKKDRVQKAQILVAAVDKAIQKFVEKGSEIIHDNPEASEQLGNALGEVKTTGQDMVEAAREFSRDPTASALRVAMIKAARSLLSSVTRLLIIADMVDLQLILESMQGANSALNKLYKANSHQEVQERFRDLQKKIDQLDRDAGRRAADLKDPWHSDCIQAARAVLKTTCPMLHSACKAFVRHPEVDPARHNREFTFNQMNTALANIEQLLNGNEPNLDSSVPPAQLGQLISALNEFDQRVFVDPISYNGKVMRPALEAQLEAIISGAAAIADSTNTRDERKNRIVQECNAVRQALQDLLTEYEKNVGRKEELETLDMALVNVGRKTRDLRRHLRRAVIDHVSDCFLDTQIPLLLMIDSASKGDRTATEQHAVSFLDHANKLVEVANLTCTMSAEGDGIKMVRYAAMQVQKLAAQVVNAARLLAARHKSKPALENMQAFREAWEERVHLLTLAVDSIITLDDFLAVSEAHIVEDVKNCIQAVVQKDLNLLDHSAGAIRGRSLRVCQVVDADMEFRPQDLYCENVKKAVLVLRNTAIPQFARKAEAAVEKLNRKPAGQVDLDELIDVCGLVHRAVQDIRHAVLMNRDPGDIDSDEEYEYDKETTSVVEKADDAKRQEDNRRDLMRQLPEEDKKKIQEQIDVFKVVQHKFEREVAKWDETGNDIVVLAKYMCCIMLQMTDFTRGRGPLKNTMDVINAAKKISEAGSKLNALATRIADECVESETKKDLLAYLQRITLYCHQLNITSKVKADVQQVGNELIASALESATSLIQAAKNLLNAVVLTVKSAYIASTKYPSKKAKESSLVVWKMRTPNRKPMEPMRQDVSANHQTHGVIRRASQRRDLQPVKILSQFSSTGTGDV